MLSLKFIGDRCRSGCGSGSVEARNCGTNNETLEGYGMEEGTSAIEDCPIREDRILVVERCCIGGEIAAVEGYSNGVEIGEVEGCGIGVEIGEVEGCGIGVEIGAVEGCGLGVEIGAVEGYGNGVEIGEVEGCGIGVEIGAVEGCGLGEETGAVEECSLGGEIGAVEVCSDEDDGDEISNGNENDTEFLVMQATQRVPESDIGLELRLSDISEDQKVDLFMTTECSCNNSCYTHFSRQYVKEMRLSCMGLTSVELDLIIMGQLIACTNTREHTATDNHHPAHDRKRSYTHFLHQGRPICKETFHFLHVVGAKRLKNIMKSLQMNGIAPRVHGNINRMPPNTLTLKDVENVILFLLNHCEKHALLLPGRVPGYSRTDIKLLPSSTSKRRIWKIYKGTAEQEETRVIAYSTFCRLWRTQLPYIILMKPMTDLCWKCQQNGNGILRAANSSDSVKSARIEEALEHLRIVTVERSHYRTICKECEHEIKAFFSSGNNFTPPPIHACVPANSNPIRVHYSFDFAQKVHFPSDPMQPGPIYFLTPRKCSVFGVNCEAIPRQINFLGDEAGDCGKGSNTVISQLHYFFENHGQGETEVFLHADNCTGQNKNNIMLWYLAWRVMTG